MAITIRNVETSDAKIVASWKQDPYIIDMALDNDYQTNENDQKDDINRAIDNEHQEYKIIENNIKPIGYIRIDWIDEKKQYAWLRLALGEDRRKGYAKKALNIYLDELFKGNCIRIEGEIYQYNIPSQKLLEHIGFVKEGIKRKAHFTGSDYVDVFCYGLLKEDFVSI